MTDACPVSKAPRRPGTDSSSRMRIEHECRLGVLQNLNRKFPTDRGKVFQENFQRIARFKVFTAGRGCACYSLTPPLSRRRRRSDAAACSASPHDATEECHPAETARTALGFSRAMASNVRAAPLGCLRPCSQPCRVRTETPRRLAN